MKILLLSGLLASMIAADTASLLPPRWQDARHTLLTLIRPADTPLVIITDGLDDRYLRRTLHRTLESGKSVTLITASAQTASHWAMYRSLRTCMLPSNAPLSYSLVRSEKQGCLLSSQLTTEALRSRPGMMLCTGTAAFDETLRLLLQECKPYFDK